MADRASGDASQEMSNRRILLTLILLVKGKQCSSKLGLSQFLRAAASVGADTPREYIGNGRAGVPIALRLSPACQ